jgi:nickel transport protein
VELVGPDGGVLAEARTDEQGEFRLPLPEAGPPLTVRLYASMGHAAEYRLPGAEPGGAGLEKEEPGPGVAEAAGATTGGEGEGPGLSRAELRREVRSAVEEALAPVRRRLARQEQRRVTAQDVIGGVGYIVGLLGVALYLKSRKGT